MEASTATASAKQVKIVELADNSRGSIVKEHTISMQQYQQLLQEPGQMDCPLLEGIGYPIIIVSTKPGQRCIPVKSRFPVSDNPHNNWMATTATSRIDDGLAPGIVVGDMYALRRDGKDLTLDDWGAIWDVLQEMMDYYGEPDFVMTPQRFLQFKNTLQRTLPMEPNNQAQQQQQPSNTCWFCGKEATGRDPLWTCGRCKTAKYCSVLCQKSDWKRGHKADCTPAV